MKKKLKIQWKSKLIILLLAAIIIPIGVTSAYYTKSDSITNNFISQDYSFTIYANGGIYETISNLVVANGEAYLPTPARTGYTFLGYSTTQDGNVIYSVANNNLSEIDNGDFYAVWEVNNYTITYILNGGSIAESYKTTYTIEDTFDLPIPTRSGYTFDGWTSDEITTPTQTVTISSLTGDKTFTANWSANTYYVAFNANGGSGTMSTQTYNYNESYNLPSNSFTKSGYTFTGWNTSADGTGDSYSAGASIQNLADIDETITLYAQWKKTITITFMINGASAIGATSLSCDMINSDSNCTITFPTITAASGFSVLGWGTSASSTSSDKSANTSYTVSANATYYAITRSSQITITFDKNGATSVGSTSASCYRYNGSSTCSIKTPSITYSGWTVLGFSTSKTATSASYSVNTSYNVSSSATWYAITRSQLTYTFSAGTAAKSLSATSVSCYRYNGASTCQITTPTISLVGNPTQSGVEPGKIIGFNKTSTATTATLNANTTYSISSSDGTYYSIVVPSKTTWTTTASSGLYVRSGPSTSYSTVKLLSYGTTVTATEYYVGGTGNGCTTGVWFKITSPTTGYICTYYLK